VAELLASADSSGDGKLQVGEFIKWIFAEDPKAIGLGFLDVPGPLFLFGFFSVLLPPILGKTRSFKLLGIIIIYHYIIIIFQDA